jgi:5-methylcytosine-specific restriction enzyme A
MHLYNRSRWRHPVTGLRAAVLRKFPICCKCKHDASTVADHIRDHHGDEAKFWDFNNLQGLCEPCHSEKTLGSMAERRQ